MGLDQYLFAEINLPVQERLRDEAKNDTTKKLGDLRRSICEQLGVSALHDQDSSVFGLFDVPLTVSVKLQVMYWRKANQIHNFFVREFDGTIENCDDIPIKRETLQKLLDTINTVLADHSQAETLLPTASGFFFGSTEYDEWYFKDLEETKLKLDYILGHSNDYWKFIYHAWW
jgi:hypothetical protein